MLHTPRLRGLRSALANPLAGGDAGGLAKPVPRRLLEMPCAAAQPKATWGAGDARLHPLVQGESVFRVFASSAGYIRSSVSTKLPHMHTFILFLILVVSGGATAQVNYTKTAEIQPLRTSFNDLQGVLTKTSALVSTANSGTQVIREELKMKAGVVTVTLRGHNFVQTSARIPEKIDSMAYSYLASDSAKISRVSIDLDDYRRLITVEGSSPEQVDAIFAVLREDLQAISTPVGGWSFQLYSGFPAIFLLTVICVLFGASWYSTRARIHLAVSLSALVFVVLFITLPVDELLSGFWAIKGEPSFMVRYGPHMSFAGLVIAVVGIGWQLFPAKARTSEAIRRDASE